jgi:hypothetical protein
MHPKMGGQLGELLRSGVPWLPFGGTQKAVSRGLVEVSSLLKNPILRLREAGRKE